MSDSSHSLINVDLSGVQDLVKPIDSLVNRVSDAIGLLYNPTRIVKEAQAEVSAAIAREEGELILKDMQRRAEFRAREEQIMFQQHIESVLNKSLPVLREDAKPELMNKDWITMFFEKARLVSEDEMQTIWARILAGEANQPGSFSKRTLSILADFDRSTADTFMKLNSYAMKINERLVVVVPWEHYDLIFDEVLLPMDSMGLINIPDNGTAERKLPADTIVTYGHHKWRISLPGPDETKEIDQYRLATGSVRFTPFGMELSRICSTELVPNLIPALMRMWHGYKVTDLTDPKN